MERGAEERAGRGACRCANVYVCVCLSLRVSICMALHAPFLCFLSHSFVCPLTCSLTPPRPSLPPLHRMFRWDLCCCFPSWLLLLFAFFFCVRRFILCVSTCFVIDCITHTRDKRNRRRRRNTGVMPWPRCEYRSKGRPLMWHTRGLSGVCTSHSVSTVGGETS